MKKIIVKKILLYDPTYGGKFTKYDGYNFTTIQKLSPSIIKNQKLNIDFSVDAVLYSSLKRGEETAKIFKEKLKVNKMEKLPELKEVRFSLKKLLTKEEFELFGSDLVRQKFIEFFIKDQLLESRKQLKKRIEKLLLKLSCGQEDTYLLISHSFFMKLLQIYLQDNRLFDCPGILRKYFDPTKKTFDCGAGFSFNLE